MSNLSWLQIFLPKLRCPQSHEALREATVMEKVQAGLPVDGLALASERGGYVYPVVNGIPHLLPDAASCRGASHTPDNDLDN